ncbi:MAG: biosynthetic peptidoglycan transglycosylase [Clostridia bacterium]|nr:biosynthetic peptidoglycan transglycosylase [Clostridia bacterium]
MRGIKSFFTFIAVMLISVAVLAFAHGYLKYSDAIKKMPLEQKVSEIQNQDNFCTISDLPKAFVDAFVSVEDRRFYSHNGFDIIGTARAIWIDIKEMSLKEGGSTITQQLAKNMYFPLDNTVERKIAEILTAFKIEQEYSKDEILELYFNCIYYGSGYYGIFDASVGYFGKIPSEMSIYESTLLAGVPNAPSVYSPKVNLALAHKRQEKVLKTMAETNTISTATAKEVLAMQSK